MVVDGVSGVGVGLVESTCRQAALRSPLPCREAGLEEASPPVKPLLSPDSANLMHPRYSREVARVTDTLVLVTADLFHIMNKGAI